MANRVELKEEFLDDIVGGAFHYNTMSDGSMTCRVDGAGLFHCSENAKRKISLYIMNNEDCTLNDVVNYALSNGYFWK